MLLQHGVGGGGVAERRHYRSLVADSARWDGFVHRPGDIVISTPPKCGTTWMQRLVAMLVFDGPSLPAPIATVSPWLDMQLATRDDVVALLDAQSHRRFIKTHTPLDGLPFDPQVSYVCVLRDPRDVAVSSAHHMSNIDVDQFLASRAAAVGLDDLAEFGITPSGPAGGAEADPVARLREWIVSDDPQAQMSLGAVFGHARCAWDARDQPNVALFHYGDLLADLPGQLIRLAAFLGYDVDRARAEELAREATFEAMKSQAATVAPNADIGLWRDTTEFFHRGTSGQWQSLFGPDELSTYEQRLQASLPPELGQWLHTGWLGESVRA
jgi:hypothetical protein